MKKLFFCFVAMTALIFASCSKNPAESFEGTYNLDVNGNLNILFYAGPIFPTTYQNGGSITIALDGEDGDFIISGYYEGKGHVDKDGTMKIQPTQKSVSFWTELTGEMTIPVTIDHGDGIRQKDKTIFWESTYSYTDDEGNVFTVLCTNTATRK